MQNLILWTLALLCGVHCDDDLLYRGLEDDLLYRGLEDDLLYRGLQQEETPKLVEGMKGNIQDLFLQDEVEFTSEEYSKIKAEILKSGPGLDQLQKSWDVLERKLSKQLDKVKRKGGSAIPETSLDDIINNGGALPANVEAKVKKAGVVVVRGVLPQNTAHAIKADLLNYLYDNNAFLRNENDTVYEVYWAKAQMEARQHPNMERVIKALLAIWNSKSGEDVNLSKPLMYVDRMRIRPPASKFPLPPHMDGGSVERWVDPEYRSVYQDILAGQWERYDPWRADHRAKANMNQLGHANGATFFRAFQGWMSLTDSGPGSGTLQVVPLLKEVTSYLILRALLPPVPAPLLPGCMPGKTLHVSKKWHPAITGLVSIPQVAPGDTVWWHPDLVHSVEEINRSGDYNSVLYIPAGPDCTINREYSRRLRHALITGNTPPDFPRNNNEKKFPNRVKLSDLSPVGLRMMGWPEYGQEPAEGNTCQTQPRNH